MLPVSSGYFIMNLSVEYVMCNSGGVKSHFLLSKLIPLNPTGQERRGAVPFPVFAFDLGLARTPRLHAQRGRHGDLHLGYASKSRRTEMYTLYWIKVPASVTHPADFKKAGGQPVSQTRPVYWLPRAAIFGCPDSLHIP